MTILDPPMKWHGGKYKYAKRILALAPPHETYVEPYCGACHVLLRKNPDDISEVVNDVYGDLTNFWRVLQDEQNFAKFHRIIEAVPCSEIEFRDAMKGLGQGDTVQRAVKFFIAARLSLSARMKDFTSLTKKRLRRRMNEQVSAWLTTIEGLPTVHARLKRVLILNDDALEIIRKFDSPTTWFYLDPPYLQGTRTAKDVYQFEMTEWQHKKLLLVLSRIKGKFALSGYRSKLYDLAANKWNWKLTEFPATIHSAGGKTKRKATECVWMNY